MADHFYGTNLGGGTDASGISTGTSTTSKTVEVRIHDGDGISKTDVLIALEKIAEYITKNNVPA